MKKIANKKCAALILAAVTALSLPMAAMAADPTSNSSVALNGTIASITALDVTVPVSTTFTIDEQRNFTAPMFVIKNNSPVPVTVVAQSVAADGASPKVVAMDKFSDTGWRNLNRAETQSNIALGVKVSGDSDLCTPVTDTVQWFSAEGSNSDLALGTLKSNKDVSAAPQLSLDFDSRYGSVWGDMSRINYTMTLTFGID